MPPRDYNGKLSYGKVDTPLPEGFEPPEITYAEFDPLTNLDNTDMMIYTTIPPRDIGDTDSDPFGWTECYFCGKVKQKIYQSPYFLQFTPAKPPQVNHRIGPSPVSAGGLGMFATRPLKIGDLILSERPLFIATVAVRSYREGPIPDHLTMEQIKQVLLAERENQLRFAINRMTPQSREAYMALANSHTEDGSGPITGIIRTNGFGLGSLFETDLPNFRHNDTRPELRGCSAVCNEMSRINHSCSPNVFHVWDTPSFSYRLTAARDIAAGEEIFVKYTTLLDSASNRQESLEPYGFSCKCAACSGNTSRSDTFRTTLDKRVRIIRSLAENAKDPASRLRVLKAALSLLDEITREGLETNELYNVLLMAVSQTYGDLGDDANASKYSEMSNIWHEANNIIRSGAREVDADKLQSLLNLFQSLKSLS